MTLQETVKLLAVIKAAYPEFGRDISDAKATAMLWQSMIEPYSYDQCNAALKQHIQKCKFAPKISEIIEGILFTMPALAAGRGYDLSGYMSTKWERRSMRNLSENMGITLSSEIHALVYQTVTPRLPEEIHE